MKRLLTCLLALFLPIGVLAADFSGSASYRERIAMPADAVFRATLFDISNTDQVEIGRFETSAADGPPYNFVITYPGDAVSDGGRYAIRAEVIWPDRPFFVAGSVLDGFPATPDLAIELIMTRATAATTGQENTDTARIGAHGLALPATYVGTVMSGETATDWHLNLFVDQVFHLKRTSRDAAGQTHTRSSLGRWHADPLADALVLNDGAEMPLMISTTSNDRIRVLDANTRQPLEGDLATDGTLAELELNGILIAGMMTYMADAAIIEECMTGSVFPMATDGDYLALESAYLADRTAPGAPLYVMLEGGIAMREGMEGPTRQTVSVDRFIRTRSGITCERQRADASLRNTYWRLDQLDGAAVPQGAGQQEPHIVLETTETNGYRATLGCNRMRGEVTVDADAVRFSPGISTMMACPPPLDTLEGQFNQTMSEVIRYSITGETLVLSDENGTPRAIFTAVYF